MNKEYTWDRRMGWLMVSPALSILIILGVVPVLFVIYVSFMKYELGIGGHFIGVQNFVRFLTQERFWHSVIVTGIFVVISVGFQLALGIIMSLALNTVGLKMQKIASPLVLLPILIPPVVVGMLWRLMLRPRIGSVSYLLSLFGIDYVPWFDSGNMAIIALLMTDIWEWTPFITLILLSGLQSVPSDIYEAADLESATPWRKFWDITLPLLRPIMGLAVVLRAVDAFKIFDLIHVMTGGGPGSATESIGYYTYKQGFVYFDMGLTAAMSLAQLFIIMYMARFLLDRAIGTKARRIGRDGT